jgi:HAD superfamily hydrolase (TIGR01509 family)
MMKNNKIIFFDIGNVFFQSNLKHNLMLFERRFRLRKGSLYISVHDGKWWKQFSIGMIKEKDYMQKVAKDYMDKNSIALNKEQLKIFLQRKILNGEMISYAKKLKEKFRIGVICNTPAEWYRRFEKDIKINFDYKIVSGLVHARKPDKKIFKKALDISGASPKECIYIDDRKEMLAGAKELGFKTLVFRDVSQIKKELNLALRA